MKKVFKKNKVVAVIVTYNRKDLLKECIQSILKQKKVKSDILVIDNNSSDGTFEYINDFIKSNQIIYLNTGENLGGAGGFNFGLRKACELGYKYLWIIDDDCIVHKDTLFNFFEADKNLNGNYGFLSSKVLWKDGNLCVMNKQKKTFGKWLKDFDTNYQKIAMASFVSMFIKSDIIKEFGLPIKDFFIWTDDWEFSRRISRKLDCYYISSSVVTHKCKENIGASIDVVDGDRLDRFKYLYRNDCVLYRGEGFKGKILFSLRILFHKFRVYKSSKKDKKKRIDIINKAVKEGKKFYPKIEFIN